MKKNILCVLFGFVILSVFAVDWPQSSYDMSAFDTQFAGSRGSVLSAGVVYSQQENVSTVDSGEIIFVSGKSKSLEQFDSPLGNTVIVVNEENLMNIYGNLDTVFIKPYQTSVSEEETIGKSGKSGWIGANSGVEFQVADIISKTVINPFILFSKPEGVQIPVIGNVTAVKKTGAEYNLSTVKFLPSDMYYLYFDRNEKRMPFKIVVFVNGKEVENITYNMLKIKEKRLSLNGKNDYIFDEIFPGSNRQLISSVILNKGKTIVMIKFYDMNNNEKSVSYSFEVR